MLSHDLFEGIFARCALVTDVEFFDDFPATYTTSRPRASTAGCAATGSSCPGLIGRAGDGAAIPPIGRWKMFDNLRRTLSPIACVLLLLAAWSMPGAPQGAWIAFVLAALAFPGLLSLLGGLLPRGTDVSPANHLRAFGADFGRVGAHALISVITLPHQARLMLDAIVRTLTRLYITRRRLLVWVTAAQAGTACDLSLSRALWPPRVETVVVTLAAAAALLRNPGAAPYAAPFLLLWLSAPLVMRFISLPPREEAGEPLSTAQVAMLRSTARRTWRFFTTFVTVEEHALPPDNFQETPAPVVAHRSSPTNFGLYLLSCVAARDFGWIGTNYATTSTRRVPPWTRRIATWCTSVRLRHPAYPRSQRPACRFLRWRRPVRDGATIPAPSAASIAGIEASLVLAREALKAVPDDRRTHLGSQGRD